MKEPPDRKMPARAMEPGQASTAMSEPVQVNGFIDPQAVYADISYFGQHIKRTKAALKRFLIACYCWNLIPRWIVTAAFRTLRLEVL